MGIGAPAAISTIEIPRRVPMIVGKPMAIRKPPTHCLNVGRDWPTTWGRAFV